MKLLFLLFITSFIGIGTYVSTSKWFKIKNKSKRGLLNPLNISVVVVVFLIGLIALGIYSSSNQADLQCASLHQVSSKTVNDPKTASDWFAQGNYDYDNGNCQQAVSDYTKSIALDPTNAQVYNNRAYTNMRLRNYKDTLPDLDKAIMLNPNYVQALMNRGDIHNYYYQIDRQASIADYRRVIALTDVTTRQQTSVCGHLFLAKHDGWTLGAFLGYFTGEWFSCE